MKTETILESLQNLVDSCHGPQFKEAFDGAVKALRSAKAAPPERKIVQISEGGIEGAPGRWDADAWITGLCNDGSVWRLYGGKDGEWYRIPPIPQGDAS